MIDKAAGGELGARLLFLCNYSTDSSPYSHDTAGGQRDTDKDRKGEKKDHLNLFMEKALAVKRNDTVSINFTTVMLTTGIALLIPC